MTRSLATILFLALGVGACTQSTDVVPVGGALGKVQTAAPVRPPDPHATPASMPMPIDRYKSEPEVEDSPGKTTKPDLVRGTKAADPEDDYVPGKTTKQDLVRGTKAGDPEDDDVPEKRTKQDLVRGASTAKVGPVAAH
jgi:hypothetical protein